MKIWLKFLLFFFINLLISQEEKALLKDIINTRENHLLNQRKSIVWQEYNHTTITSDVEKIKKLTDTIWQDKALNKFKIDSSSFKLKQFNSNKHFFQSERNVRHERKNSYHRSIVTKYKMAGFEQPIYESIALEFYSQSIFDDDFFFFHNQEVHPLSKKGLKKYSFEIITEDNKYIIHFKQNNKRPIFGTFIIDKTNYQIISAEIKKVAFLDVSAKYFNKYDAHLDSWMPKYTQFTIKKGEREIDYKILGNIIYLNPEREKGYFSDEVYLQANSSYFNFEEKPIKYNKKNYVKIDFDLNENESFFRTDKDYDSDFRNENTYCYIDSISTKNKIEKRINIARKFYDGFYPLNQLDINLKRLINYNNHEGLRLGLGLQTNEKFSKKHQTAGHLAHGFRDRKMKYYFKHAMRVGIFSDSWISFTYQDDIREIGSTKFQTDYERFIFVNLRPLNLTTFYGDRHIKGELNSKILPRTHTVASLSYAKINPLFDYSYFYKDRTFKTYNITSFTLTMRWEPWSDFMQTPVEKLVYTYGYPRFTFQFTQSLSGYTNNDFNFQKFDVKSEYRKRFWNKHELKYFFQTGVVLGSTPLTHLYSVFPNSSANPDILMRFDISGKNTFETMRRNEFFSDRFIFSEIIYEIPFRFSRTFQPIVSLVNRYGIGNLDNKEKHLNVNFNTMEKGYWESGVEFFNLFNWFGLSSFYRHGPYSLPTFKENISIKLNFRIVI